MKHVEFNEKLLKIF